MEDLGVVETAYTPDGIKIEFVNENNNWIIAAYPIAARSSEDGAIQAGQPFRLLIQASNCPYYRFRDLKKGKTTIAKCLKYLINSEDKQYLDEV